MEELLENKIITRLTEEQNINFIKKLDTRFRYTSKDQQLMVSMFYDYLNYENSDENSDEFVVDLNDVWKMLGFKQLSDATKFLNENFTIGTDYKKENVRQTPYSYSYDNNFKEPILLTVDCFKRLCAKKSELVYDTYKEMEDILYQVENVVEPEVKTEAEKKMTSWLKRSKY